MSLEQLNVISQPCEIPDEVTAMLAEAEQRCDAFFEAGLDRRYPRYLPSNPEKVFAAIATLKESGILRGDVFCEWGSGFGIATCIASLLGFKAYGIEIEDGLVKLSTELAQDLSIPAEYLCTSYLPEGYEECEGIGGKDLLPPQANTSGGAIIDTTPLYDGLSRHPLSQASRRKGHDQFGTRAPEKGMGSKLGVEHVHRDRVHYLVPCTFCRILSSPLRRQLWIH